MKIGFGVPNPVPGVPGHTLLHLARRAEERDFSGLATIDRIAYPSYDSLATLAAAAGATSRIELITNILLAPLYPTPHLARTAASIDQLSGGRFTLGMAPGGRPDDFELTGSEFGQRGKAFDGQLEALHKVWRGEWPLEGPSGPPVGPTPVHHHVPVLIGGTSEAALRRVIKWGAGWTAGGGGPQMAAEFAGRVRTAWADAGREGEPRIAALAYFSLGDELAEESRGYLLDYYGFLGSWGERVADSALRTPQAIRDAITAFTEVGCTELYLVSTTSAPDQADRLADVVF
ncbi:MAG TPA: LLM class flavin-dependent oxidoreductase [Jiangellaceae bacterium]